MEAGSCGHAQASDILKQCTLSAQGEVEGIEKQIMSLSQKKEDLLVDLKAAVLNLHRHLQQEQQELEKDKEMLSPGASEDDGVAERDVSEWKVGMTVIDAGPTFRKSFTWVVVFTWNTCGVWVYGQ